VNTHINIYLSSLLKEVNSESDFNENSFEKAKIRVTKREYAPE